jgi:hypothetical protein
MVKRKQSFYNNLVYVVADASIIIQTTVFAKCEWQIEYRYRDMKEHSNNQYSGLPPLAVGSRYNTSCVG